MAVYKVPQDVEAEDKFLGPLSFKQFLFFGGAMVTGFLMYQVIALGVAFLVILILPFFIVCVTLAFPWTKDQPTELWLASRIRFFLVQHKRIWDQDDVKELVTITAPKREVHTYSDGLSQDQVVSRLNALANVVDSKGWAVKQGADGHMTDRLATAQIPTAPPTLQHDEPDPLDEQGSAIAQQFDGMIQESQQKHRKNTRDMMDQALKSQGQPAATQNPTQPANSPWFLQQDQKQDAGMAKFKTGFEQSLNEQQFLEKVHKKQEDEAKADINGRMKTIQPIGSQQDPSPAPAPTQQPSGPVPPIDPQTASGSSGGGVDPAILALAQNDDLNIETIARQANREIQLEGDDEVVISLHEHDERR